MSLLLLSSSINPATLEGWPRCGMSIAGILVSSAADIPETVYRFADCGVQLSRVNLLSALWPQTDTLPYRRRSDGLWDLYDWNPIYFDRLDDMVYRFNREGIVLQLTNYEEYSFSFRKAGPQQIGTPWRNNVNGVYWPADDSTFQLLPDEWSFRWFEKVKQHVDLTLNVFEIGNEFHEKALHERVAGRFSKIDQIQVNRNEDTPGQYANMMGKGYYDFIAFHGDKLNKPLDLYRIYPREPDYKTFNRFFHDCPHDPRKITFSSDGARISDDPVNTYDWEQLRAFFKEIRFVRGCSIEHQSRAKMTPFPNHHMIEGDWFKSVINP